jgi:hypothetical protein
MRSSQLFRGPTIVNDSLVPIILGSASSSPHAVLNFVTPSLRGTEIVRAVPFGRTETIAHGSSRTFAVTYPYRLGRPGTYRFNVSYGGVDSNIVTYAVK